MTFFRHGSNNRHRCSERELAAMAEGGHGGRRNCGTSARNRLAQRGSNAELLLWVSSVTRKWRALEKKSRLLQRQPTMSELDIVRWTPGFKKAGF